MKLFSRLAALLFVASACVPPFCTLAVLPGCASPPQKQAVVTLKAVGYAGKAAIDGAWELRKEGHLSEEQWQKVAAFYDDRFQPVFRAAVRFAKHNERAPAPLEIVSLLSELQALAR